MKIDWDDGCSHVLINPCYSQEDKELFQTLPEQVAWPSHVWMATSGSQGIKWVGLSKEAILSSAQAVNNHLNSNTSDCWIQALPSFHIGGLSIEARCCLSGASLIDFRGIEGKWDPDAFYHCVEFHRGSLTSLVPAQLYDLIKKRLVAPSSLRAVLVGGGALTPQLYTYAQQLGWPVLPSYGLTECGSQVATAPLGSNQSSLPPLLKVLPHIQVKSEEEQLSFKGASLFTAYATFKEKKILVEDPKISGWFKSEDCGFLKEEVLHLLGRVKERIKIGGETVHMGQLEQLLCAICMELHLSYEMALIAMADPRLGHVVHLVAPSTLSFHTVQLVKERFDQRVLPFERIRKVHFISSIPRSALGKVLYQPLLSMLIAE